ncbi:MAG: Endonuclease/Exonuclease/phosphatase family [Pseudomonadota bacterium]|jgi:predicted extracellular nuclease
MRGITDVIFRSRVVFSLTLTSLVVSCFSLVNAEESAKDSSGEAAQAEPAPQKPKVRRTPLAGEDPRGPSDLTACSQNLKMYGTFNTLKVRNPAYTRQEHAEKIAALVERFDAVNCDVIALQEVMGEKEADAKTALDELAVALGKKDNRVFSSRVAPPGEGGMTLGFLVANDRASILNATSYAKVELPKLAEKQRPRLFLRTPMELQISVPSRNDQELKTISLVNLHFKSKRGAASDPTGLEWETYRMEMAEALRRIIDHRHKQAFASSDSLLLVMGDRNGNYDVASARILEGSLVLQQFRTDGACRLSKRGVPICKTGTNLPQRLFSVFARNERVHSLPGTFSFEGEYSWLDDILMPAESLPFAWKSAYSEGEYDSGVVYAPKSASDHALVYVKLNW